MSTLDSLKPFQIKLLLISVSHITSLLFPTCNLNKKIYHHNKKRPNKNLLLQLLPYRAHLREKTQRFLSIIHCQKTNTLEPLYQLRSHNNCLMVYNLIKLRLAHLRSSHLCLKELHLEADLNAVKGQLPINFLTFHRTPIHGLGMGQVIPCSHSHHKYPHHKCFLHSTNNTKCCTP